MNWQHKFMRWLPPAYLAIFLYGMASFAEAADVQALYKEHCVACHGENRLGGIGPALLPESLERLRPDDLLDVLRNGRPATQMQGFSKELGDATIKQMATWLRSAPAATPRWEQAMSADGGESWEVNWTMDFTRA